MVSHIALRYAVYLDTFEYREDGYPLHVIRSLWLAQPKDGHDKSYALALLTCLTFPGLDIAASFRPPDC